MSKKCYRFYGCLLSAQANWLNKMAANGYRLIRTGKMLYEFERCTPGQYRYQVEFIGEKSKQNAGDYAHFLEDCGYRVFFKNSNLNYSVGKICWRPWAEKGGRIATTATTCNRELLIVEKENDGRTFALHTTYEDQIVYYKKLRKPWLFCFFTSVIMGIILHAWPAGVIAFFSITGVAAYQMELRKLRKQAFH